MNHRHPSGPSPQTTTSLSSRELQVLSLLSTGAPIKRVAQQLDISAHTVNQHVRQIYLKLAVHNRIMALNRARQLGLLINDGVPPPQPTLSY